MKAKNQVIGILAHVDAGKTTLTEAILYNAGKIRKMGRVDHKNSCFDTHEIERQRGITIFSEQCPFTWKGKKFTLIDTPGHVDFSAEMERILRILDYAVLVIDGNSSVQGHTETIWSLLQEYQVPVFLFINKMDRESAQQKVILGEIRERLGSECLNFTEIAESMTENQEGRFAGLSQELLEEAAMLNEEWMQNYLEESPSAEWWIKEFRTAVQKRQVFPCIFGSALQNEGVVSLLSLLGDFCEPEECGDDFQAEVYKIRHDSQGNRLTFLKITAGKAEVRMPVVFQGETEKISQIRVYSGEKFESVQSAETGMVCAVTGLTKTKVEQTILHPLLSVTVLIEDGTDIHTAAGYFRILEDEMPELSVRFTEKTGEIQLHVMGRIQLEILEEIVKERFGMQISFGPCRILYKETLKNTVMGYGHYEPLKHYAEVHVRIAPGVRGSGIQIQNECSLETLDKNYQNLALTHIREKEHLGILAGAPLTDVIFTLTAGKSHQKHTEGGDFREAVYRAIRQGLEKAENTLLEPYYSFQIRVPSEMTGRVMSDIQRMHGSFQPPQIVGKDTVICGEGPVSEFMDYAQEVRAYTKDQGTITFRDGGYRECHNQEDVIQKIGYEKERDWENPSSSIFCSHGAGYEVKWHQVDEMRHIKEE